MFIGYVQLENILTGIELWRDSARAPVDTDLLPTFRVYGPDGLIPAVSGASELLDAGVVSGASNATPVVITSVNHGLTSGTTVTVRDVGGNSGANGTYSVTALTADTFQLDGAVGNGDYTSGGTWNVTGLYWYEIVCTAANGFEAGLTYYVLHQSRVNGVPTADTQVFIVT